MADQPPPVVLLGASWPRKQAWPPCSVGSAAGEYCTVRSLSAARGNPSASDVGQSRRCSQTRPTGRGRRANMLALIPDRSPGSVYGWQRWGFAMNRPNCHGEQGFYEVATRRAASSPATPRGWAVHPRPSKRARPCKASSSAGPQALILLPGACEHGAVTSLPWSYKHVPHRQPVGYVSSPPFML